MYLRSRIATSFFISAVAVVLLASFMFSRTSRRLVEDQYLDTLRDAGALILPQIGPAVLSRGPAIDSLVDAIAQGLETRVTVMDTNGIVLGDSQRSGADMEKMENHAGRREMATALSGQAGTDRRASVTLGVSFLYHAEPIWDQGHVVGVLRVASPLVRVTELERIGSRYLMAGLVVVLAASLIMTAFLGGWFTRPMRRLQGLADNIAAGDYDTPLGDLGGGELADLGFTIQKISGSLKSTIRSLEADREMRSTIFGALADGVMALDEKGKVIVANEAAGRLLEIPEELVGRDAFELLRRPEVTSLLGNLRNGKGGTVEISYDTPPHRTLRITALPVSAATPELSGLIVIADITTQASTLRMRRDFFNNASHELRTPLTSIIGYLETLEDQLPPESPLRSQYLDVLVRQADRMRRIIDDLLTLAQVESEQWPMQAEAYDIAGQAAQILELFRPAAAEQNQSLRLKRPQQEARVYADREKIHMAFSNLIDNAVKYAGVKSHIEVTVEAEQDHVRVTVADDGPGIPRQQTGRIFERFYRLDKSRSGAQGGTGLGLSIVRNILAAHEQEIQVESDTGAGARFSFRLPAPATQ